MIYRTLDNRRFCKKHGIRLSGPALGRPCKNAEVRRELKKQAYEDELKRNAIEGKFGQGKRRFGLGRVMSKLARIALHRRLLVPEGGFTHRATGHGESSGVTW
jgi:hypothetical protein